MRNKYRPAWRLLRVAVLICAVALAVGRFSVTAQTFTTLCVAGNFQIAAGHSSDWDPGAFVLTDGDSDGIYTYDATISAPGDYEFKIVEDCAWGAGNTEFPSPRNAWFWTDVADQPVTFSLDTNTYNDGYTPSSYIPNVTGDTHVSLTAVGPWQGWNNENPATVLSHIGGGVYAVQSAPIPTPGTYEGKFSETGNWGRQITVVGREVDTGSTSASLSFTTTQPNETVTAYWDSFSGRAKFEPNGDGDTEAEPDDDVWWNELGHDSRDTLYRTPGGAVETETSVKLRFRSAKNDLTAVQIRIWNDRADQQILTNMVKTTTVGDFDYWEYTLDTGTQANVYYYRFIAIDGTSRAYYEDTDRLGGWGEANSGDEEGNSKDDSWQLTVYDPDFKTPDWVKTGVFYQIFVDRFRDGDETNNLPAGTFFYNETGGTIHRSLTSNWNTQVCDPRATNNNFCDGSYSRNFYGGDLDGLIEQLDYIADLGVTVLYLNPIFESPSNHKYDTRDFSQIDDNFGTLADFEALVAAADTYNMKIVLDGVFNHTSSDSFYFDRYNQYDDTEYGVGACESNTSPRANWYTFFPFTGSGAAPCSDNRDYPKWFGIFDSLPVLRTQEDPAQDLIWGDGFNHTWSGVSAPIAEYWIDLGADGWRLDVAPEVDHGIQRELDDPREQFNPYWEEFRKAVHGVDPLAYIVGEEWGLATSWTSGGVSGGVDFSSTNNPGEWDATMNYQFGSAIMSYWRDTPFSDNDHNEGSSAGVLNPINSTTVNERLLNLQERYAPEAFAAMMNLLGSHDTSRALFMLDHGHPTNPTDGSVFPADTTYTWTDGITRLKGVALMQFTLPGAPTIYYGDEVGLVGQQRYAGGKYEDDPYNRQPFPWLDESGTPFFPHLQTQASQDALSDYYTTLATTRNAHEALSIGDFRPLLMQDYSLSPAVDPLYVYGRRMSNLSDAAVTFINRSSNTQNITVDVSGYLPEGAVFDDVLTAGADNYTVSGGNLTANNVPAMSGALLVMTSIHTAPPVTVNDLSATAATSEVTLNWTGVGADSYAVYRSNFSGGGYEFVGTTASTTFTDISVDNGTRYYYVVVSRNNATSLESGFSNEASAIPEWDLTAGGVWYGLQWPQTIVHTISTTDRTDEIYAQIYIPGGTDTTSGQTPGIRVQVGYGTAPNGEDVNWLWAEMAFISEEGSNDQYVATLLPMQTGTFYYTVRFSTDNGESWSYAEFQNPFDGNWADNELGTLTVNSSGDENKPSTPTNLTIVADTATSITLEWGGSVDTIRAPGVYSYRIYRDESPANGFVLIGSVATGITTYTDTTVSTGVTYDYQVTAVDTSFNESDPSNTVTGEAVNDPIEVTFITHVPASTPDEIINITGNQAVLGNWNPSAHAMTQVDEDTWTWVGTFTETAQVQYKHTRAGTWDKVEVIDPNNSFANHVFTVADQGNGKQTVETTVTVWHDPYVVSHTPADGAVDVSADTTITVTFNKSVNADTEFTVIDSASNPVAGAFVYDDTTKTVTFTPDMPLADDVYTVTVSGVSGGGTQQIETTFSFRVGLEPTATFTLDPSTPTFTPVAPTETATSVPSTSTATAEPGTPTNTPVVSTATETQTATSVPSTSTSTFTPMPPTATFTPEPTDFELIYNGGFEIASVTLPKQPDGWTATKPSKDRLKCDTISTFAFEGQCAYRFKGVATERAKLSQNISLTQTFAANDELNATVQYKTNAAKPRLKFKVRIFYNNETVPSGKMNGVIRDVSQTYTPFPLLPHKISNSNVTKIKVQFQNLATSGKIYLDNVSLTLTKSTLPQR